jgi:hypothetical protein
MPSEGLTQVDEETEGWARSAESRRRPWRSNIPSDRWRDRTVCLVFGEAIDEGERAGLLTSRSSYSPRLSMLAHSGILGAFVTRYSGATARDLHPIPYSPIAVATGTLSRSEPQYVVVVM